MMEVRLTDRAPVKIDPARWPKIASASGHDAKIIEEAFAEWHLVVRQEMSDDGDVPALGASRVIVYGKYLTVHPGESETYAGEILNPDEMTDPAEDIADTIRNVGVDLAIGDRARRLVAECIAGLPAQAI